MGKVFQAGLESRPGVPLFTGSLLCGKGVIPTLSWWLSKVEARKGEEEGAFEQGLVTAGCRPRTVL